MLANIEKELLPNHIAIVMDGNRRWAKEKKLDTRLGHKAGAENLEKIAKYANKIGIKYMTVYAFSTENWKRTEEEVGALMMLLKNYVNRFLTEKTTENIRIKVLGNIEQLNPDLQASINKIIKGSENNTGLTLNIAFNYGGRDEIKNAVQKIYSKVLEGKIKIEDIDENVIADNLYTAGQPDPDLLIRPGGELRLSNFLLWQSAYTEFLFIDKYWPDFSEKDLDDAIEEFKRRNRKFGGK